MESSFKQDNNKIIVTIDGNIDTEGASKLSETLQEIMRLDNFSIVEFDLSTVFTTTSSGIGKLLNFYKHVDGNGGSMEITAISDSLHKQFTDIHLDRIFPINTR